MFVFFFFSETYVMDAENLHEHVLRHNYGTDDSALSINCMKIAYDKEYLVLLFVRYAIMKGDENS